MNFLNYCPYMPAPAPNPNPFVCLEGYRGYPLLKLKMLDLVMYPSWPEAVIIKLKFKPRRIRKQLLLIKLRKQNFVNKRKIK